MSKVVNVDDCVKFLNELLEIDRVAMTRIFNGEKTVCNEKLADHETVQCGYDDGEFWPGLSVFSTECLARYPLAKEKVLVT